MNKTHWTSATMFVAIAAAGCADADLGEDTESGEEAAVVAARDKRASPATDLARFPKLSLAAPVASDLAAAARTVVPAAGAEDVYAVQINDDGSGSMTIYTPPPGLSSGELHTALREQGVAGLQVPQVLEPPGGTSCTYRTANLFRCAVDKLWSHQVHWANGVYSNPQVYFTDHTGSQWPVDLATYKWNQANGVDSIYVWAACPAYSGTHCVHVVDVAAGNSCWTGLTSLKWNSAYNITSASIQLNTYQGTGECSGKSVSYRKDANGYRQIVCHEMGHALGMGHNTATSGSCLFKSLTNSSSMLIPNGDDFTLIASLYATFH
jgi:hypothetical protein